MPCLNPETTAVLGGNSGVWEETYKSDLLRPILNAGSIIHQLLMCLNQATLLSRAGPENTSETRT